MTNGVLAMAVGAVVFLAAERRRPDVRWQAGAGSAAIVLAPMFGTVLGCLAVAARWARRKARRLSSERAADADVGLLARSILISVTAGMPLPAALGLAAEQVHPELAEEVITVLRHARRIGLAQALAEASGRAGRLYVLLARAQTTGASIAGAVSSYVEERRQDDRMRALEAARRLPVKLTIPLALLILPGFVVLTVGPSVIGTAQRLLGPVLPVP